MKKTDYLDLLLMGCQKIILYRPTNYFTRNSNSSPEQIGKKREAKDLC